MRFNEAIWIARTVADVFVRYMLIVILVLLGFVLFRLDRMLTPAPITDILIQDHTKDEVVPERPKGKEF